MKKGAMPELAEIEDDVEFLVKVFDLAPKVKWFG